MKTKNFKRNIKKFWRVLEKKLKLLMVAKKLNMKKIFKKLNLILMMTFKLLKFHNLTIIIRGVFSEDGKFYPQ